MESGEIETYFQALNDALVQQPIRKPVRLVVVGGVYMVCIVRNRASTKDVDIVPVGFPDSMNADKETKAFRAAVNAVAKQYQIKQDWMNDVVAAFAPEVDQKSIMLWRTYEHLHVYIPQAGFILALKLLAGRERDEDDILALCELLHIQTREQAQVLVDTYTDAAWQRECNLDATLDALFS